jgi:hypothetical protein
MKELEEMQWAYIRPTGQTLIIRITRTIIGTVYKYVIRIQPLPMLVS